MSYFLGIDVGASRTVAAVARSGSGSSGSDAEPVDLGDPGDPDGGDGVASVLHLGEDGALTVGAAAQRWAPTEPDRVALGFPGRIGDGAPMLLAGEPWAPEELTAWLVRWVVDRVAEQEGGPAEAVAVARPASWDEARTTLLTAALAEQEIDARFLAAGPGADPRAAACAVAVALRDTTAGERPGGTTASGRHAAVVGGDGGPGADDVPPPGVWDMPAPRSHESGVYSAAAPVADDPATDEPDPRPDAGPDGGPAPDQPGDDESTPEATDADDPGPAGPDPDPATRNLVAELVGFTGGMGATNTAGLLSGYTPPHGMPAAWSGGPVAVAPAQVATAVGSAVALPSQRSGSGHWGAVAPAPAGATRAATALRARNNPTVLVAAGGLAAAVAVVGTLFLWPTPRITNSATSRPIPAVPVATAPAEPTAAPIVALTPEPTPTPRPRPSAPRTRRPVVPPVTRQPTETGPPPPASTEPSEPTTSAPPSREETAPTTEPDDD